MPNTDQTQISEITCRAIIDHLTVERIAWSGRYTDDDFLGRLYDLSTIPSNDRRYKNAAGDIHQHTVMNNDWPLDWVFYDDRFRLLHGPDS